MPDLLRYGVFLRPDPATSLAVTTITAAVRAQYGFVSAGNFPPHATLAGSLPLAVPEGGLVDVLEPVLAATPGFEVANAGVRPLRNAVVYDLHEIREVPNEPLIELARAVDAAVRPLLDPAAPGLPADRYRPERWRGHLSLASHELDTRVDLHAEVLDFVARLPVAVPDRFRAEAVALYRFSHPSWTGPWWQGMRWEPVRTFRFRQDR